MTGTSKPDVERVTSVSYVRLGLIVTGTPATIRRKLRDLQKKQVALLVDADIPYIWATYDEKGDFEHAYDNGDTTALGHPPRHLEIEEKE